MVHGLSAVEGYWFLKHNLRQAGIPSGQLQLPRVESNLQIRSPPKLNQVPLLSTIFTDCQKAM